MAAFASFGARAISNKAECVFRPYHLMRMAPIIFRMVRDTQRQFSENICSEDDLRSRICYICCKICCLPASSSLPLQDFRTSKKWYNCPFLTDFYPKEVTQNSGAFFLAEIFENESCDSYNVRITRLSARKSEKMKIFRG